MAMTKYPILQSGFVSLTAGQLTPFDPDIDPFVDLVLAQSYLRSNNPYFYSKAISEMFNHWLTNPEAIRQFEFREQILVQAKRLFSNPVVKQWFAIQEGQQFISSLHVRFLEETLRFTQGIPRTIAAQQWYPMLEASKTTIPVRFDHKKYFNQQPGVARSECDYPLYEYRLSECGASKEISVTWDLDSFLRDWTLQKNGFVDLLTCLNVIFGIRESVNDMANKKAT